MALHTSTNKKLPVTKNLDESEPSSDEEEDPRNMTVEERKEFLSGYLLPDLKLAYSCFVSHRGLSKLRKRDFVEALANISSFTKLYEAMRAGDLESYVPVWKEIEGNVSEPFYVSDEPWKSFYSRTDDFPAATYENGKEFLKNWGISTQCLSIEALLGFRMLEKFNTIWKIIVEPQLTKNIESLYSTLQLFFDSFMAEGAPEDPAVIDIREYLPTNFAKKAAMVWDAITLHKEANKQWCELDLEGKTYRIWHDFFADHEQVADSQMTCLPEGSFYEGIYLKPDMLMKNEFGVPSVIIENGRASAGFDKHKDSPKVLAEGRLATTFTLAQFETSRAPVFLVTNGEFDMSVIIMEAKLIAEKSRAYNAVFVAGSEGNTTLKYSRDNYTDIIKLFVLIFVTSKRAQYERRSDPLLFTKSKKSVDVATELFSPNRSVAVQTNRGPKSAKTTSTKTSTSTNVPFQKNHSLWLGNGQFNVVTVQGSTRILACQNVRYFGKVVPLKGNSLPFEFELMQRLDHPSVMKLKYIVVDEQHQICMGLTPWIFDAVQMRRSAFTNSMIARGILSALDYLHEQGIVHADVKLDNIVTSDEGKLPSNAWRTMHGYLIDFDASFYTINAPCDVRGTAPYIAPEVIERQFCSPAMDMWSFGLLMFELFCGRAKNVTADTDMKQEVLEWYHSQQFKFRLVDLFFDLLMKCLESDPTKRITAQRALQHEFFTVLTKMKEPNPVTSYILGNLLNWEDEIDWEALAVEDAKSAIRSVAKNVPPKNVKRDGRQSRQILGDITNRW